MRYGAIYIAHNPRDGESLFKVGKTERLVDERMKELTASTSNLGTYSPKAYFIVAGIDEAEKACHKRLKRYRVQSNREFFDIPFERLIQIIQEVLAPFFAANSCPKVEIRNTGNSSVATDPKLKLQAIRTNNLAKEKLWKAALGEAARTIESWFKLITAKATEAKQNLYEEHSLYWNIPDKFEGETKYGRYQPFCSVTLHAQFREKPTVLILSGIRGGIYGDLDLSKAISDPEIWHKDKDAEFVRWQEEDDGRVGKIEISPVIENSHAFDKEQDRTPTPKVSVRATPIRYDDYHQHYEEKYSKEKIFSDPEEAFEVFMAVIISNIAKPQFDIRKESGTRRSRHGAERKSIIDRGEFHLVDLEDD